MTWVSALWSSWSVRETIQPQQIQFGVVREKVWHRSPWHKGPGVSAHNIQKGLGFSLTPFTKNNIHALGQQVKGSELRSGRLIRKVAQQIRKITLSNSQILPILTSEPFDGEISLLRY